MRLSEAPGPLDEAAMEFNLYTGRTLADADGAAMPTAAQLGLEPPRYCGVCGRRMVVQVEPNGWWAKCSRHGVVDSAELERR